MTILHFQDVWDRTLSNSQKEEMAQLLHALPASGNEFDLSPIRIKYKKNGGLVATVFLRNNSHQDILLQSLQVQLLDRSKDVVADHLFDVQLNIPASSALPWSFVFPADCVMRHKVPSEEMTVIYKIK
ncbi:SLAP domain-containing protein [Sporosarcina sp. 179-K 3D1 HS]|uniref:SLAP domain-containing protein n=1 Tax=Sporosarcina sp. 179-K 3D1 HS TaxID=3232169 RepID=UPI0039A17EBD